MGTRPLIGITTERFLAESPENPAKGETLTSLRNTYYDAVLRSGGLPVLLPIEDDDSVIGEYVDLLQGLVVTGNAGDVDPHLYGEEPQIRLGPVDIVRSHFEIAVTRMALERDLAILGICGGHHVLNVALGGTLIQDIPSEVPNALKHRQRGPIADVSHHINVAEGNHRIRPAFEGNRARVNSYHHQSILQPGKGLRVLARADDGVIEAVESEEHRFAVGVQWHPERLFPNDLPSVRLFQTFVEAAKQA